jgi:hypothetical protein
MNFPSSPCPTFESCRNRPATVNMALPTVRRRLRVATSSDDSLALRLHVKPSARIRLARRAMLAYLPEDEAQAPSTSSASIVHRAHDRRQVDFWPSCEDPPQRLRRTTKKSPSAYSASLRRSSACLGDPSLDNISSPAFPSETSTKLAPGSRPRTRERRHPARDRRRFTLPALKPRR